MINVHFVYLGAALGAAGSLVYVRDTLRGTTQPNRVTWLLWAFAPLLAFAVEIHSGVGLRALTTFVIGFMPLLVFIASFHNSAAVWRIRRLDYACGAMSLAGTAAWLITRNGVVAIAAAIAADFMAGVPTMMKSWSNPESETVTTYIGAVLNLGDSVADDPALDHRRGGVPPLHFRHRLVPGGARRIHARTPSPPPPGSPCRGPPGLRFRGHMRRARRGRVQTGLVGNSSRSVTTTKEPNVPTAHVNGVDIEYVTSGDPADPALLLVMGLGAQLIAWPEMFVERLTARGFFTIRFDNRDSGLSTKFEGVPDFMALFGGDRSSAPYLVEDMAEDALGVLDELGLERAHVVGVSMGGMITQALVINHPARFLSATSIMSTTGDVTVGAPTGEAVTAMLRPAAANREEAIAASLASSRVISSPGFPFDVDLMTRRAAAAYDRSYCPEGTARQLGAILASADRTEGLRQVKMPVPRDSRRGRSSGHRERRQGHRGGGAGRPVDPDPREWAMTCPKRRGTRSSTPSCPPRRWRRSEHCTPPPVRRGVQCIVADSDVIFLARDR